MRFTRKGAGVDLDKAEREVMAAINAGVNYFDTAYIYPGSEAALGEILERNHCRDRVCIASKLPQYLCAARGDFERYFAEELRRLRTDRIDYYLMHMLTESKAGASSKPRACGSAWPKRKRRADRAGGVQLPRLDRDVRALLDCYDWDFCQIQYNYMDENSQAGRAGLQAAAARGLPSSSWSRCAAASWSRCCRKARAAVCRQPARLDPGRMGAALAVGPAGSDLCFVRHEQRRDGGGKLPHCGRCAPAHDAAK